jgi:hypothetical protein
MKSLKRKIATNIPSNILDEAVSLSGLTQTGALIEGLKELIKREKRKEFLKFEGQLSFALDLGKFRGR